MKWNYGIGVCVYGVKKNSGFISDYSEGLFN